ncbi:MAG: isoprenylcysteine carboxylmethyltransferase family protein [Agriterribacter sp.]
MGSLFFRNLLFTILQPGMVAGLIPFSIAGRSLKNIFAQPFLLHHFLGTFVFIAGFIITIVCIASFAMYGKGTLSPADPTKKLVIRGLYKFSRNPMYVGVTMMLMGEAIFFQSTALWAYAIIIFTAFNLFIIFFEEPRLRDDFGEEYKAYREKVRRWI